MKLSKPKYIFVTGGVASSLGKGIISASIARLLQARGYSVTIQKLDPYINVDPGTLNPYEHGECYVTEDGAETEWSSANYYTRTEAGFGRVAKKAGQVWPLINTPVRAVGGIRVEFTAGYGTDPADVPAPIRQAVKMIAQHLYENRESQEMPNAAAMILSRYKVMF